MGRGSDPRHDRHLVEGRAHFQRGAFASAMRELAMAQRRDPTRPEVHRLLGLCYARQGRSEEAHEALREALRLNPLDFVARGALAVLLSHRGDPATAIEELERGKSILTERVQAIHQEGKVRVESGRLPDAMAMLRQAAWLRLGAAVLQYYLDGVFSDHCLLELAFRGSESAHPAPGNGSGAP